MLMNEVWHHFKSGGVDMFITYIHITPYLTIALWNRIQKYHRTDHFQILKNGFEDKDTFPIEK